MPAITSLGFTAAVQIQRALAPFGRLLVREAMRFVRAIKNRRAAQALARFDDRMLADIGLTRGDLRDAYGQSVWQDPTNLLRARALERRLARHGLSHGLAPEHPVGPPLAPNVDAATVSQARMSFCKCG